MAKSAQQLFRERVDPSQIGNPQLRQQVMRLQRENYQQQVAQVNANYQAWRADNAGVPISEYFAQVNGAQQYTVKEGDTLPDIANKNNTTVPDILNANPDMTAPKTGMVINAPRPRPATNRPSNQAPAAAPFNRYAAATPAQMQAYGAGAGNANVNRPSTSPFASQPTPMFQTQPAEGFGLPSNAAFGATTTNPQGANPTQGNLLSQIFSTGGVFPKLDNLFNQGTFNNPKQATPQGLGTPGIVHPTLGQGGVPLNTPASQIDRTNRQERPRSYRPDVFAKSYAQLISQVSQPDYTPTPVQIQTLKNLGLLKPSDPKANGGLNGNYSYGAMQRRRGYGGGGGGGGGVQYTQRYNPDNNEPAFSGGGGFRGLVNWRI